MTKLGPHCIGLSDAAARWAKVAPVVKSIDNVSILAMSPDSSIKIFRHFFEHQNLSDPGGAVAAILSALHGYRHPNLVVEVWNEAHPHIDALIHAITMLHAAGLKTCGTTWGTGDFIRADFDAAIASKQDYFGLHAYWGNRGFTPFHALRYRDYWRPGDPPILITECGRDAVEGGQAGWRKSGITAEQYVAELVAYDAEINKDANVRGATVFSSSPTPDWSAFDVDSLTDDLLAHLPGGTPVVQPQPSPFDVGPLAPYLTAHPDLGAPRMDAWTNGYGDYFVYLKPTAAHPKGPMVIWRKSTGEVAVAFG